MRSRPRAAGLPVGLLLTLWLAAPAAGYTPLAFLARERGAEEVRFLSWQEVRDGRPVRFAIGAAGTPDIELPRDDPAVDEFDALELAFRAWQQVPGVPVRFDLRRTARSALGADGESVIFFADLGPVEYGAMTLITYDNTTGRILEADIHLDDHGTRWITSANGGDGEPLPCPCPGEDPGPGSVNDVQGMATHEIGHALGLDHSAVGIREAAGTPTMYPRGIFFVPGDGDRPPNSRYRTLALDDIAGLENIYPPAHWSARRAEIAGRVHDRHDRPLFGAHVVATSLTTGVEVGAMSGVLAGPFVPEAYALRGLPPDRYTVRVEPLDGSAPGFVGRSSFGGITAALIPTKLPSASALAVSYHHLATDTASATPLPVGAGAVETVDFRPFATLSPLPRFIRAPVAFDVHGTLNADVTGPLVTASLAYTLDGTQRVAEPLTLDGGRFSVTIPPRDGGHVLAIAVEAETTAGRTLATEPLTVQVGLSCEPVLLLSENARGRLSAVDSATLLELDQIPTSALTRAGGFPLGQAFHEAKRGVYVANFGPDTVTFVPLLDELAAYVDPTPLRRTGGVFLPVARDIAIEPGADPWAVALSPGDQEFLYVTGSGTDRLYQVGTGTDQVLGRQRVGSSPKGVAVTPDGTKVYVANVESHSLSVLDAATLAPLATVPLGGMPHYVSITADGATAVVTMTGVDDLVLVDVRRDTVVGSMATGLGSPGAGLVFLAARPPDRGTVLAGKFQIGHNRLAVIDIPARRVSTIDLGTSVGTTGAVAFHPDGERAYVVDHSVAEIVELEVATGSIRRRLGLDAADIRDLLVVDANGALCSAACGGRPGATACDGRDCTTGTCNGERCRETIDAGVERFVCWIDQALAPDVCTAPLPQKFRRAMEKRGRRAAKLARRLGRNAAAGARQSKVKTLGRRIDKTLGAMTNRVAATAAKRNPLERISQACAAAIRGRLEASRAALR